MQGNNMLYKYVEEVNVKCVYEIETYFNILLPNDYKVLLATLNRGKPLKDQLDIKGRLECVIDYFINLSLVTQISKDINQEKFIAVASDPFGNYYGYLKENNHISSIYFWDHEIDKFTECSNSFGDFIEALY